jgi:hypothetical protein
MKKRLAEAIVVLGTIAIVTVCLRPGISNSSASASRPVALACLRPPAPPEPQFQPETRAPLLYERCLDISKGADFYRGRGFRRIHFYFERTSVVVRIQSGQASAKTYGTWTHKGNELRLRLGPRGRLLRCHLGSSHGVSQLVLPWERSLDGYPIDTDGKAQFNAHPVGEAGDRCVCRFLANINAAPKKRARPPEPTPDTR